MRALLCLLMPLVVTCAAAAAAHAEEVDFNAEVMITTQKDLPKGWEVVDEPAEGLPTEEEILGAGGEAVDEFSLTSEYRALKGPDGMHAVVCIVDVDTEGGPHPYTQALMLKAAPQRWVVKQMGHPTRLMLIACSNPEETPKLVNWQSVLAADKLCKLAFRRILSDFANMSPGKISRQRAAEYSLAASKLVPKAAAADTIKGLLYLYDDEWDLGLETIRDSLKPARPLPPEIGLEMFACHTIGGRMLMRKDATLWEEAAQFLERARGLSKAVLEVAKGDLVMLRNSAFGARYNLACAYSLMKRTNDALSEVDEAMNLCKLIHYGQQYKFQFIHFWLGDEDLANIRSEKKFEELTKKYAPKDFDWEKEREEFEKRKKEREEAKKKQDELDKKKDGEKDKGESSP